MTEPKQVSDFAKEYQQMYIGLGQCKSAYEILRKQLDERKAVQAETINGLSNEFKAKFNTALDRYDELRNARGKFRLKRQLDFEVISVMDLFLIAFDQLQADAVTN